MLAQQPNPFGSDPRYLREPSGCQVMSGNSLLLSLGDEFRAVPPVANPFGLHFTVCNFLAVPLDQQLSVLHFKKAWIIWYVPHSLLRLPPATFYYNAALQVQ